MAAALATLCGRKYHAIGFDFPMSDRCRTMIGTATAAAITAPGVVPPRPSGRHLVLNFSGGMDSLAAWLVADRKPRLVSMDFGAPFEREADYFSSFDTLICRTDFRQKGFGLNDWRFMAAGSLLFADMLDAGLIGFGSIFEATPANFAPPRTSKPVPNGPFGAIGSQDVSWTRAITEIGTAMIVLTMAPEMAEPSLRSLAAEGTEKYHRKQLLLELAARRLGAAPSKPTGLVRPRVRTQWGKSFAVDFLTLFFVHEYGRDYVSEWADLPEDDEFAELVSSDLGFFAKYNSNLIGSIPEPMRNDVLGAFHRARIYPFNETDFASFARVRGLLARFHAL